MRYPTSVAELLTMVRGRARRWALSDLALDRPVTVGMLLVAVLVLGIIATFQLPLAFLPTENTSRIYIRASITRTSPEILEREVIRPMEEQVAGIRDLKRIHVGSGSWGVRVNLEFLPGTDIDARKLELRDRLDRLRPTLPEMVQRIEIGSYSANDDPVLHLQISSATGLTNDYNLVEQRVVRPIERIEGVSRVDISGLTPDELEVTVDLEAVDRQGASLSDLGTTVRSAQRGRSLGLLHRPDITPAVRSPAEPAQPERFAALPIGRSIAGTTTTTTTTTSSSSSSSSTSTSTSTSTSNMAAVPTTRLGEVASIAIHPEELRGGSRLDGRPAVHLSVYADAGASAVDVSRAVRAAVATMNADPMLRDLEVGIFRDQGQVILRTLGDLRNTGTYGAMLAALVLFAFLRRVRTTFAAAISIPLNILVACGVLFLRGDELNCLVLLGLVLGVGMLIDNAVVIVESIEQHVRRGASTLAAVRMGAREVAFATMASTLSTIIVFLPLMLGGASDAMNAYLRPLGITFSIGLIASLVVSQTAVPLLIGQLIAPRIAREHVTLDRVSKWYASVIRFTLRHRGTSMLLALMIAATAVWPSMHLNYRLGDLEFRLDGLPIRLEMSGSRSYKDVLARIEIMESALLASKDALAIDALVCEYRDRGGNCTIHTEDPMQSEAEVEAYEQRLLATLPIQPGVRYRINERDFHWTQNRDRKVVEFAIKGEDMGVLMDLSERVAVHLRANLSKGDPSQPEVGGYDTITGPFNEGSEELHVLLDAHRMHRLGVTAEQLASLVSMAFQGVPLGRVQGPAGEIGLRLSTGTSGGARNVDTNGDEGPGITQLRDLRIPLPNGSEVPLSTMATFSIERSPFWLQRVDRSTEIRMSVRFVGTDARANREAVDAAMATFRFPPGYGWGDGTQWRRGHDSNKDMLVNLALCLLLVYAVMASLFESFLQPAAILGTCLLGCVGAPWAMFLSGTTVDTIALIGLFILIGIVVNNGIMLVDRVLQLRGSGMAREVALEYAGRDRLRPVLMTASTTLLGLVPMLIHHPTLAGVYYHSIAIIVAGGLMTSTLITLLFLPAAYSLLEDIATNARTSWNSYSSGMGRVDRP